MVEGEKALIVGAALPSHISPVVLPGLHHGSAIETRGIPAAWRARGHPAWCGLATYAAKGVSNSAGQVTLVRIARLGPVGIVVGLLQYRPSVMWPARRK